jgi:hypothetical protein
MLDSYAAAKRLPVEFLKGLGLYDFHFLGKPAVAIPYRAADGTVAAVRQRIALDGKDKFRWRKGDKAFVYGIDRLEAARAAGEIAIVEGESDCHTLWRAQFAAAGLPGAGNWNETRDAPLFDGIATIYVVIEPDQGGTAVRAWVARSRIRKRVRLVRLDGFKDPSALYLDDPARFAERWRQALAAAVPWQHEADREARAARDAAWGACKDLAAKADILAETASALQAAGLVGEERAAKLAYLAVTSRVLPCIVSLAIKGPSSAGKSELVKRVLALFPNDAAYVLTSMSERALAYSEEPMQHRVFVVYEWAGLASEFSSYLVRSLLSEGRIAYETVEKTRDGLRPRRIEREGPTGLIVTTAATRLHSENETRMTSVTVADTPAQTRAIMLAQAREAGGSARMRLGAAGLPGRAGIDLAPWHALQRYIAAGPAEVNIPFAERLAGLVPPAAVRLRRDFPTVLSLVKAHALLHQATRQRNLEGAVVATIADYAAVHALVGELISEGVDATVPATVRETVNAVAELIAERPAEGCRVANEVSVAKLAQKLGLDTSATLRRARRAIDKGYLKNLEDKKGRKARLVLDDPLPDNVDVLPSAERLAEGCRVAADFEGEYIPPPPPHEGMSGEKPPDNPLIPTGADASTPLDDAGDDLDDDLEEGLAAAGHDPRPPALPPAAEAPVRPQGSPGPPGAQPKGEQADDGEDDDFELR